MGDIDEFIDYYEILDLDKTSSASDIKKSYRRQALVHHPDKLDTADSEKIKEAEHRFHLINKAYTVLSDPASREAFHKEYDVKKAAKIKRDSISNERKQMRDTLEAREKLAELQRMKERQAANVARAQQASDRESSAKKFFADLDVEEAERQAELRANDLRKIGEALCVRLKFREDSLYEEDLLRRLLSKYGPIDLVSFKKGKRAAYIVFRDRKVATPILNGFPGMKVSRVDSDMEKTMRKAAFEARREEILGRKDKNIFKTTPLTAAEMKTVPSSGHFGGNEPAVSFKSPPPQDFPPPPPPPESSTPPPPPPPLPEDTEFFVPPPPTTPFTTEASPFAHLSANQTKVDFSKPPRTLPELERYERAVFSRLKRGSSSVISEQARRKALADQYAQMEEEEED